MRGLRCGLCESFTPRGFDERPTNINPQTRGTTVAFRTGPSTKCTAEHWSHNMADRDTITLRELEPSPVEETPSNTQPGEYFPDVSPSPPHRTNTLGLSQHSPIWYLTRIQKYSSYVFSAFTVAHIANTSLIPLATRSVGASEPYILLTRPYYQSWPIAEPLLIIVPLAAHITSGLALRLYRRNLNAQRYGAETKEQKREFRSSLWPYVSGISKLGFLAVPLVFGHTFVNRIIPARTAGGSSNINLSYVSHAFAKHPAVSFAGFAALIGVTVFHTTWGWARWLGWTPDQTTSTGYERDLSRKRRSYIINGVAAATTALWMAGGFGVIGRGGEAGGWVGRQYDELYRQIPVVGNWMAK
jgi:hypothetical protein